VALTGKVQRLLTPKTAIALGATAVLVVIGILIGEMIIRTNPEFMPVKARLRLFSNTEKFRPPPDSDIGFLGQANLRTRVSNKDFESVYESDSYGFPNRMPWPETVDILFLGDSLLGGAGVGIDGQFPTLVGQSLKSNVVNLGLAGAAPNRQLRIFRKFAASVRPRLVVSCIYLAADLDGQLHFDSWLKEGAKSDYNGFRLKFTDDLYPKSFWTRVQRKSYVAGKLTELTLRWWGIPDRVSFPSGPGVLLDIDSLRLRAAGLDRRDPRLLSMIESLKEMRSLSQTHGANFVVMLIPSKEEIYGAPFIPEVMKPAQILAQELNAQGFSILSTYDTVRERAKHRSAFFTHDIHLNGLGNQIVSDALADWIKQTRTLPIEKNSTKSTHQH
jgi:hypothetical protein